MSAADADGRRLLRRDGVPTLLRNLPIYEALRERAARQTDGSLDATEPAAWQCVSGNWLRTVSASPACMASRAAKRSCHHPSMRRPTPTAGSIVLTQSRASQRSVPTAARCAERYAPGLVGDVSAGGGAGRREVGSL